MRYYAAQRAYDASVGYQRPPRRTTAQILAESAARRALRVREAPVLPEEQCPSPINDVAVGGRGCRECYS